MGSKNLKAIVARGNNGIKMADLAQFNKNIGKIWEYWKDPSPSCAQGVGEHGTIGVLGFTNDLGILPTRNFKTGVFEGAHKIDGEVFAKKYSARGDGPNKACFACPAGCARLAKVDDPKYASKGEGPEYESIASLGFCYFLLMDTPEQDIVDLLESATGVDFGGVDAMNKRGEKIFIMERMFNLKAGLSAKDDTLPRRFLKEPMPDGPCKGQVFEQDQLLPDYYRLRKWDENGVPLPEKLKELGIES